MRGGACSKDMLSSLGHERGASSKLDQSLGLTSWGIVGKKGIWYRDHIPLFPINRSKHRILGIWQLGVNLILELGLS